MNAPDMPATVKLAGAKALLERLREKTALVRFWRYNAAAKHGVPLDEPPMPELVVIESPSPSAEKLPVVQDKSVQREPAAAAATRPEPQSSTPVGVEPTAPATGTPTRPWLPWVAWASLAAAPLAGGVGYWAAHSGDGPSRPSVSIRESPLQYIEDQGGHLP